MEERKESPRPRSERSPSAFRPFPAHQVHYWEPGLWGTLTLLSLFAGAVMATPQTWHHNQKLGATSGRMGTASHVPMEENSQGAPSLDTGNNWHESATKFRSGSRRAGREKRSNHCRLRSKMVTVSELGLGYDSEELVRFIYCSGSCQAERTNYDLALSSLLEIDILKPDYPSSQPCCRPTRYKDFTFMDARGKWNTMRHVMATDCGCGES